MSTQVPAPKSSIIVSAAIAASSSAGTATLYTAPANGYAIVQISVEFISGSVTSLDFNVGGIAIQKVEGSNTSPVRWIGNTGSDPGNAGRSTLVTSIYLGPSQSLSITSNSGANTAIVTGVAFINS